MTLLTDMAWAALWVFGGAGLVVLVVYCGVIAYFLWTGRDVEPDVPPGQLNGYRSWTNL